MTLFGAKTQIEFALIAKRVAEEELFNSLDICYDSNIFKLFCQSPTNMSNHFSYCFNVILSFGSKKLLEFSFLKNIK